MIYLAASAAVSTNCTKDTTSGAIVGFAILLGVVGAIVALVVANSQARTKLAAARAELGFLRPEYARLQQILAGSVVAPTASDATSGYGIGSSMPAQWYPDPRGRHEYRYWNGSEWTGDVADRGVTSIDPVE